MNEHAARTTYPLQVEGELDGHLSRWQWLVKWVLVYRMSSCSRSCGSRSSS